MIDENKVPALFSEYNKQKYASAKELIRRLGSHKGTEHGEEDCHACRLMRKAIEHAEEREKNEQQSK